MKFHKDIYLPPEVTKLSFSCLLKYTRHALNEAQSDRYGTIDLPAVFDTRTAEPIDATIREGKVQRVLYRMDYDQDKDLCMVIEPHSRTAVTVWLNEKNDEHKTLDKSKYVSYDETLEVL